ncbi:histidine kinase [Myroides marinus]|nr:histidine kinase [Myroides marinus]MDM1351947.1 histidine kinase [Myroides marinus]MDM1355522.1 histidine kinase [Myroides marinus]MDM1359160.1 histidine kinase [Myroides marinus]MDM1360342.1 histidine kinase [Myroides marinus]
MKWYANYWIRNVTTVFFLVSIFTYANYVNTEGERTMVGALIDMLPTFCLVYFFISVHNICMVKRYLLTKRYEVYFSLAVVFWSIVIVVCGKLAQVYDEFVSWPIEVVNVLFLGFLGMGAYFIHLWIFNDITVREKRLVNTEAELDFLKMQLNPHFLLNAMNNLYGEALTNPSETPERILQLSLLLRYQLEATKKEFITLDQEIEFLKEYFNYYKFRTNSLVVDIKYDGDTGNYKVPPLLYFSLVENAVKFAIQTEFPYIKLRGNIVEGHLYFELENSCLSDELIQKGTGLGLINLERRLEVSSLKYRFEKNKTKNYYKTTLELWELPTNV